MTQRQQPSEPCHFKYKTQSAVYWFSLIIYVRKQERWPTSQDSVNLDFQTLSPAIVLIFPILLLSEPTHHQEISNRDLNTAFLTKILGFFHPFVLLFQVFCVCELRISVYILQEVYQLLTKWIPSTRFIGYGTKWIAAHWINVWILITTWFYDNHMVLFTNTADILRRKYLIKSLPGPL